MADFPGTLSFRTKVTPRYNTLVKRYANGVKQTRLIGTKKMRAFEFAAHGVRQTDFDLVTAFYDTKLGATTAFTLEFKGETITGNFVEGSFSYVDIGPGIYDYSFQFEEEV